MDDPDRFAGARLQEARFPDDTGEAAPEVVAALAAAQGGGSRVAALAALQRSRLLVPVVALAGEVEHDDRGLAREKTSDMAAVLMKGRDGRLALLAFTGTAQLAAWNPEARPVAVTARSAAESALQDDAAALLVDPAGPVPFVVTGEDLLGFAGGWTPGEVDGARVWVAPADAGGPEDPA